MTLSGIFYRGQHARRQSRATTAVLAVLFAAAMTVWSLVGVQNASASSDFGPAALNWAESHAAGHWYLWGGTGPSYDCSGLVYEAFLHEGISLPRTTYGMLASGHLHWIPLGDARRGDLLFYGSGHVEFDTMWYHTSFGAHDSGSRIGWIHWGYSWVPTMAFRVS